MSEYTIDPPSRAPTRGTGRAAAAVERERDRRRAAARISASFHNIAAFVVLGSTLRR